jgi:hypothetical protein
MSGGVGSGGEDENQLVVFTIVGTVSPELVKLWNDSIKVLKDKFEDQLTAVTLRSVQTPETRRLKKPVFPRP